MAMKSWWWVVLVVAGVLTGRSWARQDAGRDWLRVNGNDWQRMEPDARMAYVEGFLAGAALSQAADGAGDTTAVRVTLERLSRNGGFRFPFGANVYLSRMNDYYWWKNHLPLPTWYAFLEVNTAFGRPVHDSVP
jgi:hypothetical protein